MQIKLLAHHRHRHWCVGWLRRHRVTASRQIDLQNFTNRAFAYNFGNPFEGTYFGCLRLVSGKLKFNFR